MLLGFFKLGHAKETSGSVDESSALLYWALVTCCVLDFAGIPLQLHTWWFLLFFCLPSGYLFYVAAPSFVTYLAYQ